jgi:hypothetical protein
MFPSVRSLGAVIAPRHFASRYDVQLKLSHQVDIGQEHDGAANFALARNCCVVANLLFSAKQLFCETPPIVALQQTFIRGYLVRRIAFF